MLSATGLKQFASLRSLLRSFCARLTAGLDMVLRALWMVTGGGGVEVEVVDRPGTFLVSDAPCPDVIPTLPSPCQASELLARPGDEDGGDLAGCPASVAPEGSQLVLHGDTPSSVGQLPPRLSRIKPLLPVVEPCGASKWDVPLPPMNEPGPVEKQCVALLGPWSNSVPLSKTSDRGDGESLLAAS